MRWAWIEHATFRSSVWRSPNWAIPADDTSVCVCFILQRQSLPLTKQVDYYSTVIKELNQQLGSSGAQKLLSKSLIAVVIGSNDIFGYFDSSDLRKKNTPQQYVDLMATTLKVQLQVIYIYK